MGEQNAGGGSGDALYAFGVFGAATYFWQRAEGPKGKAVAVLRQIVNDYKDSALNPDAAKKLKDMGE